MTIRRRACLAAGTGLVTVLVAACGSSASSGGNSHRSTPTSSAAAPSGTPADAATARDVRTAYSDFFSSTASTAQSQAALQHGAAFTKTLQEQATGSYSKNSGVQVASVSVRGQVADVTFTITSNGAPLLSGVKGFAVREDGRWKVAAKTFCMLLTLEGHPPAACSDPAVTALP